MGQSNCTKAYEAFAYEDEDKDDASSVPEDDMPGHFPDDGDSVV
jgi:hypothetical protein